MSTLDPKPIKTKLLNPRLLPIAAILLILLSLLFMATPLLRANRAFQGSGNFIVRNGVPGSSTGLQPQTGTSGFPGATGQTGSSGFPGATGQTGSNLPTRQLALGGGILAGFVGSVVYFVALLLSLVAALGMFFMKRWGKVIGIIMAVLYLLVGLIGLLPTLFLNFTGLRNPLSLILSIVHVLLAIAVIVLASIPAKKLIGPLAETPPPAASA